MGSSLNREIPYNYTSADDRRVFTLVLGPDVIAPLERLDLKRRTGRSWRLLMRLIGDLFILRRNPFLFQELVDNRNRRHRFRATAESDLDQIAQKDPEEPDLTLVLGLCRKQVHKLDKDLASTEGMRRRIRQQLGGVVGPDNIFFDPFSIAAHATDATDWRMHLPVAVVCPCDADQVPKLLRKVKQLGLAAIPRGGGTGLTGGAVPVAPGCVVINTEKLNRIGEIRPIQLPGSHLTAHAVTLEAGVITEAAMKAAEKAGLVFATDPTSSWACTIGGNIAENAGGKKAVLWGTAIDNLMSFRIAAPDGRLLAVERTDPRGQRIAPDETVFFRIKDAATDRELKTIRISGDQLRKPGLGKDITNKALSGLPGVQKEGTDGIITTADFILHRQYPFQRTVCLEFFGNDMEEAGQVIAKICSVFADSDRERLMALEHFDEEYVRAISYKAKAPKSQRPKAVLLIDIVGHTSDAVVNGIQRLQDLMQAYPSTFMAVAADEQEAERFWQDRKRLGAIAARTNAFKLNEDIVLPLPALAEFAEFVDNLNVEEERANQVEVIWQVLTYMEKAVPIEDPEWLRAKLPEARQLLMAAMDQVKLAGRTHLRVETHLNQIHKSLTELLRGFSGVLADIEAEIAEIRARRIVVATHMHAGDGNVHVNIPVFSNDREMMLRAAEVADIIMEKAVALDGVVSGEHGIGFTKIKHLDARLMTAFQAYKKDTDPDNFINPGKLTDRSVADRVFTPSFNLIELEARILRYSNLEQLAEKISQCVRCGRCKNDCCVFYPAGNLFFHPRNKNLALTGIIEALIYDAQRSRGDGLWPLRWLAEIADHCTLCHKCQAPCPVNIDTAEVSILEREVLAERNSRKTALPTRLVLGYLDSRSLVFNAVFRKSVLKWGGTFQRMAAGLAGRKKKLSGPLAPLYAPVPKVAAKPLPAAYPKSATNQQALMVSPDGPARATVFYFPGCGSERLYSDIALAAIFLLCNTGLQVVLPPRHLCCGFPARANAKKDRSSRQALRNTIIFSQIRNMLGHIDFDGVLVTCGTCRESLIRMDIADIFSAPVMDAAAFAIAAGFETRRFPHCLYHRPCHDSLDGQGEAILNKMGADPVVAVPHCCSESGTLALSRPDIAAAMLDRKQSALDEIGMTGDGHLMLTNCPACITGLGRQAHIHPLHVTVALAKAHDVAWRQKTIQFLAGAELIRF